MKIAFVVNTTGLTGGIKVILIHANNLAAMGHEVDVIHLLKLRKGSCAFAIGLLKKIKYLTLRLCGKKPVDWFDLSVDVRVSRCIFLEKIKEYDCIIATANETADFVARLDPDKGKKFYFVQDYETWTRETESVDRTYLLPLKKIVISERLKTIMEQKFGQRIYGPVLNGINPSDFDCIKKKSEKNAPRLLMLYHELPKKGMAIGLKALNLIKQEFPEVAITLFGVYKIKEKIDFEFDFIYKPVGKELSSLYCNADILVFPSLVEGFGLPPMEAMAAGCAVVATDVGAVNEYAVNGKTALIVKPGDYLALYEAIKSLLLNAEKRKMIAKSAQEQSKDHDWRESTAKFEAILREG